MENVRALSDVAASKCPAAWVSTNSSKTGLVSCLPASYYSILTSPSNTEGSPMSLSDFYRYLKHVEYSPENLEFYMWYVPPLVANAM
jgi:hypothetical protein